MEGRLLTRGFCKTVLNSCPYILKFCHSEAEFVKRPWRGRESDRAGRVRFARRPNELTAVGSSSLLRLTCELLRAFLTNGKVHPKIPSCAAAHIHVGM